MEVPNRLPWVWGATAEEIAASYPCATVLDGERMTVFRAVTIAASTDLTYDWLCQTKLAPYSFDLIDNLGRRSPSRRTPGAAPIRVGEHVMVFKCVQSEPGREWTGISLPTAERIFGPMAATYRVRALPDGSSRLICRLDLITGSSPIARVRAGALAWGDLPMMRQQLRRLKRYAERDASARCAAQGPSAVCRIRPAGSGDRVTTPSRPSAT